MVELPPYIQERVAAARSRARPHRDPVIREFDVERDLARRAAYREAQAERCRAACRKHYASHKETYRRKNLFRRALMAKAAEVFAPHEVFRRDGWICQLCFGAVEPTGRGPLAPALDHVIPLARGGRHSRGNTQLAHAVCNARKGARTPDELRPCRFTDPTVHG